MCKGEQMITGMESIRQKFQELLAELEEYKKDYGRPGAIVITMLEQAFAYFMVYVFKE